MGGLSYQFALLTGVLIVTSRYVSTLQCEVSLPQHTSPACKATRIASLNQNKKIWTLKHDPALHGFALLNMTTKELAAVVSKDPFLRYFSLAYLQTFEASNKSFNLYNSITAGQEITNISEYLKMSAFFQSALEHVLGESARLPSRYEAFMNSKTEWISDKYFTQQRLAGANPMSLRRVTVHVEEKSRCTVKTTDGRWCHFPFTYRGKVYHKCTSKDHDTPWCLTSEKFYGLYNFETWGDCEVDNEKKALDAEDCSVKTRRGEWCHFPFTFRGKVYKKCTRDGHARRWCSTTKIYRGKWGICKGKEEKEEEKQETIGIDWKKLKATLNPSFDWEAEVQAALKENDSLESAINQGRIYALRYELCDDMERSQDLTDRDPRRKMWNFLSPVAMFASKANGHQNELVPVAIQMDFKPDSPVYSPKDGDSWMLAKLNVQITDSLYSQILEHLLKVHFLMEPFCVVLKRTMSSQHPLHQILKYHCREITVPNTFGSPRLVNEAQFTDLLYASGNTGTQRLVKDGHRLSTWEVTNFKAEIKKRGLDDRRLIPFFPYRDDGEQILAVIEHMVKEYVSLYYKTDKDVQEDKELQAYLNELSVNGTGENGGIGRIQKFPANIDTKEELRDIVTRIISQLSLQHSAVNYPLTDYGLYVPNQPTKLYNDTRVKEGEFSVFRLPNRLTSAIEAHLFNSLATLRFDSLFDYGNELLDSKATNLINSHYSYLMQFVQPALQEKNRKRKGSGYLTYPYVIPRWLPNGVQT